MNTHALPDEAATLALGELLSQRLLDDFAGNACVHLVGELGAGKTTLVRGILRALGHAGAVKSPTYTLVEPYQLNLQKVYHLDLYRVAHGEELTFVGIDEMLEEEAIKLIEWPDRGSGYVPEADIVVRLEVHAVGRKATIHAT